MDYIQIDRTNCMELILQEFPAFQPQWDLHLESWIPAIPRPIVLDIAEFGDFAIELIATAVEPEISKLTAMIERMLVQSDSVIEYAFRTMFLEQIARRSTKSGRSINLFISKLQPLGYYHWQAMDRHWNIPHSGATNRLN
jgi:hypothetical protein